jgi:hypothetical protein
MLSRLTVLAMFAAFVALSVAGRGGSSFWKYGGLPESGPGAPPAAEMIPQLSILLPSGRSPVPADPWLPSEYERASDGCVSLFEEEYRRSFLPCFDFSRSMDRLRSIRRSFLGVSKELLARIRDTEDEVEVRGATREISDIMDALMRDVASRRGGDWSY